MQKHNRRPYQKKPKNPAQPLESIGAGHPTKYGKPRKPIDITSIWVPPEFKQFLQNEALDIFTKMANAGYPFAECLAAIYLSGIDAGAHGE